MGKGRLTTSSTAFALKVYSSASSAATAAPTQQSSPEQRQVRSLGSDEPELLPPAISAGKKFCGFLIVNCKEMPDPRFGSWVVLVENPLPPGIVDKDHVEFEYTSWLTAKITKRSLDPCEKIKIEVIFDEVAVIKKGPPKKAAKKIPSKAAKKIKAKASKKK